MLILMHPKAKASVFDESETCDDRSCVVCTVLQAVPLSLLCRQPGRFVWASGESERLH